MNEIDRSPEQIQADIQRTRAALDRTLTLLERRLEPRRVIDQGLEYLRHSGGREYLSNLRQAVKEQPLPVALVGVGLAWMMISDSRTHSIGDESHPLGTAGSDARSRVEDGVDTLRGRANELGGKVSDAASQLASQTREAAQRTSQGLSAAAEATRQGAQKVRASYNHLVNEEPLALGAIGLAFGAVLAAAAPRTRQEDEWMGRPSDRLWDDAKRTGSEKLEEVRDSLSDADRSGAGGESARQSPVSSAPYDTTAQQQASPKAHDPDAARQHLEDADGSHARAANVQKESEVADGAPVG